MSLTEEQKTAKNFQEYHKRILPYLNGSFPTPIVNKFSKGDLYSTEEKIIGQWIDGKPLYQKTFTKTSGLVNNSWNKIADFETTQIQNIIDQEGCAYTSSQNFSASINHYAATSQYIGISVDDSGISIFLNKSNTTWTSVCVTVRYTKSTDSPISIGDGNDYSTDEQVVGTWIDNKPLYQKTYYIATVLNDSVVDDFTNKSLKSQIGTYKHTDNNELVFPLTAGSRYMALEKHSSDNNLVLYSTGDLSGGSLTVTVRYTKTTD